MTMPIANWPIVYSNLVYSTHRQPNTHVTQRHTFPILLFAPALPCTVYAVYHETEKIKNKNDKNNVQHRWIDYNTLKMIILTVCVEMHVVCCVHCAVCILCTKCENSMALTLSNNDNNRIIKVKWGENGMSKKKIELNGVLSPVDLLTAINVQPSIRDPARQHISIEWTKATTTAKMLSANGCNHLNKTKNNRTKQYMWMWMRNRMHILYYSCVRDALNHGPWWWRVIFTSQSQHICTNTFEHHWSLCVRRHSFSVAQKAFDICPYCINEQWSTVRLKHLNTLRQEEI